MNAWPRFFAKIATEMLFKGYFRSHNKRKKLAEKLPVNLLEPHLATGQKFADLGIDF